MYDNSMLLQEHAGLSEFIKIPLVKNIEVEPRWIGGRSLENIFRWVRNCVAGGVRANIIHPEFCRPLNPINHIISLSSWEISQNILWTGAVAKDRLSFVDEVGPV